MKSGQCQHRTFKFLQELAFSLVKRWPMNLPFTKGGWSNGNKGDYITNKIKTKWMASWSQQKYNNNKNMKSNNGTAYNKIFIHKSKNCTDPGKKMRSKSTLSFLHKHPFVCTSIVKLKYCAYGYYVLFVYVCMLQFDDDKKAS